MLTPNDPELFILSFVKGFGLIRTNNSDELG